MMTFDEVQAAPVRLEVVRVAHAEASARLVDCLETMRGLDQRAGILFAGYVVLLGGLLALAGQIAGQVTPLSIAALLAAIVLVVAAGIVAVSLVPADYGAAGSDPAVWLKPDRLAADDAGLARVLAIQVFHLHARIAASIRSNDRKVRLLGWGVWAGLASPLAAVLAYAAAAWCLA